MNKYVFFNLSSYVILRRDIVANNLLYIDFGKIYNKNKVTIH